MKLNDQSKHKKTSEYDPELIERAGRACFEAQKKLNSDSARLLFKLVVNGKK